MNPMSLPIEALRRSALALFVGADLPRSVTGLPSRAGLARDLARRHDLDESLPLTEVAQRVERAGNRWTFTAYGPTTNLAARLSDVAEKTIPCERVTPSRHSIKSNKN